ncbi:hypothetical protein [uncultured Methanobrevibacter sp.]|uniref:hypothetical protein n=1 Tax=uncultured Methanobrevibacter sp. TaxID=253161 RepID=UPI0025E324A7|nr:hypothetical protein [uncultured Methanobrevibacter sp.]
MHCPQSGQIILKEIQYEKDIRNIDCFGLLDDAVSYSDSANDMNVTYLMSSDVDDSLVNKTLKDLKAKGANVTKTGDMYKIGANELNGALRIKDVEMVMVLSTHYDMDTLVNMVESLS